MVKKSKYGKGDINIYIDDREYIANAYVMRCFSISMIIYLIAFLLNIFNIFTVNQEIMRAGFIPSSIIYFVVLLVTKNISLSDSKTKYFILFSVILVFTFIGVTITYHVVCIALLPILYATLYSSKKAMWYVYGLTVISTIVVVHGGYYVGLCDANMALLTNEKLADYVSNGHFMLTAVNDNTLLTLTLFFIIPRCLIYVTFMAVCSNLFKIISGSLEKARHTAQIEEFQKELKEKVNEQTVELRDQKRKIKESYIQTVAALSEAVDAKDRYTSGHSKRVAKYSKMIARRMGKSKQEQEEIYCAGLLHDVGKIRIPDDIINKPGKLTEEEFNMIKIHPVTGYHILKKISEHSDIALATKYHHERYDGGGYPNGLAGENIPEMARILGVADSYDAMTSNRSYRKGLAQDVVRAEIEKGKGTQFDPDIADIMLQMIDEDKNYLMRQADSMSDQIMIVGEEETIHQSIRDIMKEERLYKFTSAYSEQEAMAMLEGQAFDLVMLDVPMTRDRNLAFSNYVKEKYHIPVIVMSEDRTLRTSKEFAQIQCDDYITKPFLPLTIQEVIYNMTKNK